MVTYTPIPNRAGSRSLSITRSQGQKPACKDLSRNGQERAITPKAAYTPVSKRPCSRSLSITRSPAQKSACKDLERDGQAQAIPPEAAYTPTSNRAGSRSPHHNALPSAGICV
ncbi:ATP-dependent nuclease [Lacticaseibacillus rhamnosus]|nr:ATP-dependent nuclease [Lacticaseibacillus rhamnosus]MCT3152856.1 ATP-dependent nuclease [Lacticaseibacillus rhamnosus]MCT3162692.1 ATP-dependent nuclease [Lacticaseibacillus rhamnosus]MCT3165094.1 ATP-dependent nuclease [Lacticaseibacillus rhamnosus]MCT3175466.1 ATP-dependent nuclease [Lacticaseibacillus rhamnosus]